MDSNCASMTNYSLHKTTELTVYIQDLSYYRGEIAMNLKKINKKICIAILAVISLTACNNSDNQSSTSNSNTLTYSYGFLPNPDGFSYANGEQVNVEDITVNTLVDWYGIENICYNKQKENCLLTAFAQLKQVQQARNQMGGQCYGMAIAAAQFYHQSIYGLPVFEGKSRPADFNPDARSTFELTRNDTRELIAAKFTNQGTVQVQQRIAACKQSNVLTEYARVRDAFGTNDPIAAIGIDDRSDMGGHAVTPYRLEKLGDIGNIYVYDNNFPNENDAKIEVNLKTGSWKYALGQTDPYSQNNLNFSGEGKINAFCPVPLSLTRYQQLPDIANGYLELTLNGGAKFVRAVLKDDQDRMIGYDFDTQQNVSQIPDVITRVQMESMPPIYQVPVRNNLNNTPSISSRQELEKYFNELSYVAVGALPQQSSATLVDLSTETKTDAFRSGLMFKQIKIGMNDIDQFAFHPGGRFFYYERDADADSQPPYIIVHFDDFQTKNGARHRFQFDNSLPVGVAVAIFVNRFDQLTVMFIDERADQTLPIESSSINYSVNSYFVNEQVSETRDFSMNQNVNSLKWLDLQSQSTLLDLPL